ncbi:MAG: type III-A CRISPR-associated RAMP protein Csm5 [Chloroflexi bacterium]|nr:MAG: type III-A CRISPR-associated RAMP protein Csm5 [Chloroflexota bacterium]
MAVWNVTLTTLTPLHIGDGNELRRDFDFAARNGRTYRLNVDAILDANDPATWQVRDGSYLPPERLLKETDYSNPDLFRYVLLGVPRSTKTDARVKAFIKDVHDRPYIPGSSVKGALRTALAWTGWNEVKPKLDRAAIGRSKSWAGQPLEKRLFGPDPNHDLLRALHVADFRNEQSATDSLVLVNAQVITPRHMQSPIELEAVKTKVAFHGSITVDDALFSSFAERELHFSNRKKWLDEMLARALAHSRARMQTLAEWYEKADGCEAIAKFYRQLLDAKVGANKTLLQIGWGAGWDGKTFGTHLQQDKDLFEQVVTDFRMHKAGPNSPARKRGDAFPRSRRAVVSVKDNVAKALAPLGWVVVEMKAI